MLVGLVTADIVCLLGFQLCYPGHRLLGRRDHRLHVNHGRQEPLLRREQVSNDSQDPDVQLRA